MNRSILTKIAMGVAAVALMVGPAQASIIGVSGQGAIKVGGVDFTDVNDDATTTPLEEQWGFDERQAVLLGAAIGTDQGLLGPGIVVDSHMIFLNTEGTTRGDATATWEFNGQIIGVMSDGTGALEVASSSLLGLAGVSYPGAAFPARGMESADSYGIVGDGRFLRVIMGVTEPGDWIRVVTNPVPEPATMLLLGSGLAAGFAANRRRKRNDDLIS